MLRLLKNRKAQNTVEYAIMIALVIGAFSAMQIYVKRGLQAKLKAGADKIPGIIQTQAGGNAVGMLGAKTQYEPYYIRQGSQDMTSTTSEGAEKGTISTAGGIRDLTGATSQRTGGQTYTGSQEDDPTND